MGELGFLAILLALLFFYFIPSMVAFDRQHASKSGILVLNIFLGWTFLGWVISLVWAYSGKKGLSAEDQSAQLERTQKRVLLAGESAINSDGTPRQDIIASLTVGAQIHLQHETTNQRDQLSIVAHSAGEQIGILPPNAIAWKRGIAKAGEAMATVASVERLPSGLLGVEIDII